MTSVVCVIQANYLLYLLYLFIIFSKNVQSAETVGLFKVSFLQHHFNIFLLWSARQTRYPCVDVYSQTSLIRASLIHIPHNPNKVPGNFLYHFLFTMIKWSACFTIRTHLNGYHAVRINEVCLYVLAYGASWVDIENIKGSYVLYFSHLCFVRWCWPVSGTLFPLVLWHYHGKMSAVHLRWLPGKQQPLPVCRGM